MTADPHESTTPPDPRPEDDERLLSLSPQTSRILTWVFIGVFIAVIAGTIYVTMTAPPGERTVTSACSEARPPAP